MNKRLVFLFTLLLPIIIILFLPFNSSFNQRLLLASVVLVIAWWATGVVHRSIASSILIVSFLVFSNAPIKTILKFPLSPTFFLIIFTFLLSEGIVKSNLANRMAKALLSRFATTPLGLIFMSFILGILLIFLIPQPFPRVILLSTIYLQFLKHGKVTNSTKSTILFSIYVASTCTSMLFINGDILLNYSVLQFANVKLTWFQWSKYMTLPSLLISFLVFIIYIMFFRKNIFNTKFMLNIKSKNYDSLTDREKYVFIILIFVFLLFMTEPIHSIHPAWISFAGVIAMYMLKILDLRDFKTINIHLLLFLTAAFSIGGVLNHSGIADLICNSLIEYLPKQNNILLFIFIIFIVMLIHLILGSAITTSSVVLPAFMNLDIGIDSTVLTLIAYTVVSIHYFLPFHHATIMIGAGENHYPNSHVLKFGLALTLLVFISVLFIQIPWWIFIGLL